MKTTSIVLALALSTNLLGQDTDQTQKLTDQKVIRLDEAREKNTNATGKGVVVGIIDGPFNLKNPIIKDQAYSDPINNKIDSSYFSSLNNASDMRHGTNVTSIIVGDGKNYTQKETGSSSYIEQNVSLKGVAYESKFYGIAYNNPGATYNSNNLETDLQKLANAGVKVINFSAVNHNKLGFALLNRKIDDGVEYIDDDGRKHLSQEEYQEMLRHASVSWEFNTKTSRYENAYGLKDFATIQQSVQKNGMLLVTGSGNDGFISPRTSSSMAAYDESYRELLVVGGLNSAQITIEDDKKWKITGITQDKIQDIINKYKNSSTNNGTSVSISNTEEGKKNFAKRVVDQVVAQQGIYYAGNLFKGTSLYSIVAPAQNVAVANGAYQYVSKETERDQIITQNSGTSFATPYASGVAALVQQKYSFLTGAQLADVLLSTANSDVELPDMLVLSSNNGTAYTVVYVDNQNNNDVPKKKEDGSIDTEQVKKDLMEKLGLKYKNSTEGFNNLNEGDLADYIVKNLLKSKKDDAETHTASLDEYAVVKLTKEEIIGQGILDANKALNGLARLDINRMNKEDIQNYITIKDHNGTEVNSSQTETKTYGFYTIDTKGYDGTNAFTNDIEERKWDNKYHIDEAINSLKDIQGKENLQAGLIKTGEGTLTFQNNKLKYSGPTVAKGGTLKLVDVTAESSALYADGGTIQIAASQAKENNSENATTGAGTKAQKNIYARNGGIVDIASGATLLEGNAYALDSGSKVVVSGTLTKDAYALSGGIVHITNTGVISQNLYANGGIVTGSGKITQNLQANSDSIIIPGGTQSIGTLKVEGTYTHEANSTLLIHFQGKTADNSSANSDLEAKIYDIKGGTLLFKPVNGQYYAIDDEVDIKFKENGLKDKLGSFSSIQAEDTSSLDFDFNKDTQKIVTKLKENAYNIQSGETSDNVASSVLRDIRKDKNMTEAYKNFFATLDGMTAPATQAVLSEVNLDYNATNTRDSLNFQNKTAMNNLSFLVGTMSDVSKIAHIAKKSKLATLDSEHTDRILYNIWQAYADAQRKAEVSAKFSYSHFNNTSSGYKSNSYGFDIHTKNWLTDNLKFGSFISYARVNGNQNSAALTSDLLSLGINTISLLEPVNLIFGLDGGMAVNNTTRAILNNGIEADYNSYFVSARFGMSKDIKAGDSFVYTPIALLNYVYTMQSAFEEKGAVLAKGYDALHINTLNLNVGGNVAYNFVSSSNTYMGSVSAFAFYTKKLNDSTYERAAYFIDSRDNIFTQRYSLNTTSVYFGIDSNIQRGNKFLNLLLSSEVAKDFYSINASISAGVRF